MWRGRLTLCPGHRASNCRVDPLFKDREAPSRTSKHNTMIWYNVQRNKQLVTKIINDTTSTVIAGSSMWYVAAKQIFALFPHPSPMSCGAGKHHIALFPPTTCLEKTTWSQNFTFMVNPALGQVKLLQIHCLCNGNHWPSKQAHFETWPPMGKHSASTQGFSEVISQNGLPW